MSQEDDGARTPPQAIEAEQSVLGAMLLSADAIADVLEVLEHDDFYRPAHGLLFRVVVDLYTGGAPVDPVSVLEECTKRRILNKIGTGAYLHTLVSTVPTVAQAAYYARIVRDKSTLRRVIHAGTRIVQMGYGADDRDADAADADAVLSEAQTLVTDAAQRRQAHDVVLLADLADDAMREIEALAAGPRGVVGLPTGFRDLDETIHGLHPGQLIVVAGRPGLGKSTLALDFIRSAAIHHGYPAVLFSLEMGRTEIVMRLFSAESRVGLQNIRGGLMGDSDWEKLAGRMGQVYSAPVYIDDSPGTTPTEMRTKCRRLMASVDLRLVVVDYMQLMTTGRSRNESRQQEVSDMSRSLKLLAKELHVPVIALSQLNRNPEQRADKRPVLSDLRESGAVEQDADVVILLHREDAYDKESPRAGEADLIVAKQRNGPTRTVAVAFQGHYSRFVDMAEPERAPFVPAADWQSKASGDRPT